MAPTVVAVGTVATGTTSCTPAFPAGIAATDILATILESAGGQNYGTPSGWAHVASDGTPVSPVPQSTNTQLTVFWRRYDGTGAAPTISGVTDHAIGRMIAIRGCPTTGNPWNVVSTTTESISDTSVTWPSPTTTIADTLILNILATSADTTTAQINSMTNSGLTSITKRVDNGTATGHGGVIIAYSGVKATTGAVGASTGTLVTAGFKAMMTLAFMNAPAAAAPIRPYILSNNRSAVQRASRW